MIDVSQLSDKDIGRWIWYTPSHGDKEKGKLKSWKNGYLFIVYKCDWKWDKFEDFTAEATMPEDAEFIDHAPHCRAKLGFVCSCTSAKTVQSEFLQHGDFI